jgi:outer membrane protein OmpA-like peptidoglycan-associated protein
MRRIWLLLPLLTCASVAAFAQVTVDLHALDSLPGSNARPSKPPQRLPAPRRVTIAKPKAATPAEQATATPPASATPPAAPNQPGTAAATSATATPPPPPATLPTAAPPTVALAPIAPPAPAATTAPPQPPTVSATAASAASSSGTGLRVTFGTGQSDLNPSTAAAIQNLVKTSPSGDGTSFNVVAYAAGTPEDPSTARRLSLARALAVRSALMADGVGSSRIYVRALGASAGDETPDRVDVAVLGANAPSGQKSAQP